MANALLRLLFALSLLEVMVMGGWIDPDTDDSVKQAISYEDNKVYDLVFSDEFERDGRSFVDGHDPRWTAIDKDDYTNAALQYYTPDLVTTSGGMLNITTTAEKKTFRAFNDTTLKWYTTEKHYQSAMIQGWNKFCFTGGILEISASLPGDPYVGGLWPAAWMMGNLARATFTGTSDNIWPWSYDDCVEENRPKQRFSACNKASHFGFKHSKGRGAAEIDVLEVMAGSGKLPLSKIHRPYLSSSFQVAPGMDTVWRPSTGKWPDGPDGTWYGGDTVRYGNDSDLNIFFYGEKLDHDPVDQSYYADALSANTGLKSTHFGEQHIYRVEWYPGSKGYLRWYLDGEFLYALDNEALINGGIMPEEPMYILLNTAISSNWGFPAPCPPGCACDCYECGNEKCDCARTPGFCETLPAHYLVDWIRVYQEKDDPKMWTGCSSPDFPSQRYIDGHKHIYTLIGGSKEPLQKVVEGGGDCSSDEDCGTGLCERKSERQWWGGHQHFNACACSHGWVGPMCRSSKGFDDHPYDEYAAYFPKPPKMHVTEFQMHMVVGCVVALVLTFLAQLVHERVRRAPRGPRQGSSFFYNAASVLTPAGTLQGGEATPLQNTPRGNLDYDMNPQN